MLIILQFPFADLRAFSEQSASRTTKPNWARANFTGFVRGFGEVESRYRRLRQPDLRNLYKKEKVEKYYVNCTKRIRPKFIKSNLPAPWTDCRHVFSRLISDGRLSFRLEVGVHVGVKATFNHSDLRSLLSYMLESDMAFRDRKAAGVKLYTEHNIGRLADTAARIRRRIESKTTLHAFGTAQEASETDNLDFLGLLVFVDSSGQELEKSVLSQSQILPSIDRSFGLVFFEDELLKQPLTVWAIGDQPALDIEQRSDKQRRVRLHILRFSSELRALEVALAAATSGLLKFGDGQTSMEVFEGIVSSSLDRLIETSNETATDIGEMQIGQKVNAEALFDIVEKISRDLKSLNFTKAAVLNDRLAHLKGQVGNILIGTNIEQRLDFSTLTTNGGDIVAGDQIKGNKGGVIGKTIRAKNMTVFTSWSEFDPEGKIDEEKLAEELAKLRSAMDEDAATDEQLDELTSVRKAELAAKNKDSSKLLEHLSGAGKWALSVAEKIGVPVAIAVLKKAAGM